MVFNKASSLCWSKEATKNLIEVINAEDIGKMPDENLTRYSRIFQEFKSVEMPV